MTLTIEAQRAEPSGSGIVLSASGLVVDFPLAGRRPLRAVNDVSFDLGAGEILGVVGESGSGKTTVGRVIAGFLSPTSGQVKHANTAGTLETRASTRGYRNIQMIFQESAAAMNPRLPVWKVIGEAHAPNHAMTGRKRGPDLRARSRALLDKVGLPEEYLFKRATELSGGEKQRVAIARALAAEPVVMVCDEAVSALDVSIRAVILNLFLRVREETGTALLFISHDISVVGHLADRVLVMHDGAAVEVGTTRQVIDHPHDDYTRRLIAAVPRLERIADGISSQADDHATAPTAEAVLKANPR
jgi:peptide/nickel transport system ATP-binding protein